MCEGPGVRGRRGGAGRWPLPLFSRAEPLLATHLRFDGGTVEEQEGGIQGTEESQRETLNYCERIVLLGVFKGPVCNISWDALA